MTSQAATAVAATHGATRSHLVPIADRIRTTLRNAIHDLNNLKYQILGSAIRETAEAIPPRVCHVDPDNPASMVIDF